MNNLARQQDRIVGSIRMKAYSPVLNKEKKAEEWLAGHAPDISSKLIRQKEKALTLPYEELLLRWEERH